MGLFDYFLRPKKNTNRIEDQANRSLRQLYGVIDFLPDATFIIDTKGEVVYWNPAMEKLTGVSADEMIGKGNYEHGKVFYGENRPMLIDLALNPNSEMEQTYDVILRDGHVLEVKTEVSIRNRDDRYVTAKASALFDAKGTVIGAIESFHDLTELRAYQREMEAVVSRRTEALEAFANVGKFLLNTHSLDEVFRVVTEQIGRLMYAEKLYIALYDKKSEAIDFVFDNRPVRERSIKRKMSNGLTEYVIRTKCSLYLHGNAVEMERELGIESHGVPAASWLGVPMMMKDEVLGVLAVQDYDNPEAYDVDMVKYIQSIANEAAIAIVNARLYSALEREKKYFQTLLEICPVAIVAGDTNGELVIWNPAAEKLFGYSENEVLGRNIDQYIARESQIEEANHYSQAAGRGEVIHAVTQRSRKNGDVVDVELDTTPIEMYGTNIGFMATYHDISELMDVRKQFEKEKIYFETLVRESPVAIITTNSEIDVLTWNPAAEALFGYSESEAIGQNLNSLVAFCNRDTFAEAEKSSENDVLGLPVHYFSRRCKKDGTLVDVEILGVPVVVDEKTQMIISIYHDITELVHARQAAEAANRSKGSFLANMSHEIRTPMNAVLGFSNLVLNTPLTDQQRDYIQKIDLSAKSLLGIINDILDFSKIEAGRIELEHIPFELEEVIENIVAMVSVKALEKNLEIGYDILSDVPSQLLGDPLRLGQILMNLANNAVKFTENGSISIRVSRLKTHNGIVTLRFDVKDTGIGIAKESQDKLFQAFTQADNSITRKFGGTGLGLSIASQLVELMGGRLSVSSALGSGSVFSFTADMAIESMAIGAAPEKILTGVDEEWCDKILRDIHILIAEDTVLNQELAVEILKSAGIRSDVACNGVEAIDKLKQDHYDLVLMDVQMPIMDGLEATRRIKGNDDYEALPIIAMTAHAVNDSKSECLEAGMCDFVSKPFNPDELLQVIKRWLPSGEIHEDHSQTALDQTGEPESSLILPGIDVKAMLERINGDKGLLRKLFVVFMNDFSNMSSDVKRALYEKDYESAGAYLHKLKGAAGSVSAVGLHRAVLELEKKLDHPKEISLQMVFEMDEALEEILMTMANYIERTKDRCSKGVGLVEDRMLWEALINLKALLVSHNFKASECYEILKGEVDMLVWGKEVKSLENAIEQFDYEKALVNLELWITRVEERRAEEEQ
ncbi:MAG: PAS domain S-box protein [Clostridia bacterium]|nr:PAS domain S-box protein [Clostridia bacterium]